MNHPKKEDWIPYVFNEVAPEERRRLKSHLQECAECREEIAGWERSLNRLDAWKLPRTSKPRFTFEPLLNWAVAAAIVMGVGMGFAAGRVTSAKAQAEQVRAAIEPEIRQRLRTEFAQFFRDELARTGADTLDAVAERANDMLDEYTAAAEAKRQADARALNAALEKMEAQRVADYVSLKQDVDTVAINTAFGLHHTEQALVQLADTTQPAGSPNSPPK